MTVLEQIKTRSNARATMLVNIETRFSYCLVGWLARMAGWQAVFLVSAAGSELSHLPSGSATSPVDLQSERGLCS